MMYQNKRSLIESTVRPDMTVLDVGFTGQGVEENSLNWPHAVLKKIVGEDRVYGLDIMLPEKYQNNPHYKEASAESFDFPIKFDAVFAGDIIEHLSNPGLFLDSCKRNLAPDGILILTTPNTFNLFNIVEKFTKNEPTVNSDHTFYFNPKVLKVLLQKNLWKVSSAGYVYRLDTNYKESFKKRILNAFYWLISKFSEKFLETMVVIAVPNPKA